ncbi:Holliday junction branch migration protein RuvA [Thiopseudomonas acetoxidans]|uniref:Holliday junction branch migration complex subunit RuvA n=1 Tax=Thiopseudomonas acetoxidans TaxID=3041622 RepID=A0ABT7SM64_9GAMM|nr:Holliday junction branch migration protein RuvA [Thiopseudomonas sp. CY1220]MDM7857289.1 Holliday junction branch migration protein RuvA [Thiopseudomonas sp. CY1220]
MIGYLRGVLLDKQPPFITLDVNGVGYELEVPMSTLFQLPEQGKELELHTHLVVREDAQLLFGFYSKRDRLMFRELIRLNGVGPKLALALMSGMSANELIACVHAEDTARLMKVPGVGKKTAERLLVELKGRFKDWDSGATAISLPGQGANVANSSSAEQDALSALISLGYKPAEASRSIRAIFAEGLSSEELIRRALQSSTQ